MVKALDKLFAFCASLKLAICLILSLAAFLAVATIYERQYGTRAVQDVVYGSRAFVFLLAVLAVNVMAAVVVRYPWKRKQTGFIITHIGIEVLLAGCLISFRSSVDGRMSLFTKAGAAADAASAPAGESVVDRTTEQLTVTLPEDGGKRIDHVIPLDLWADAGYPSLGRFIASAVWPLPDEARWPDGHRAVYPLGENAGVEIMDWLPAAKPVQQYVPDPDGAPAARVHVGGSTPMGMPVDESFWLAADESARSVQTVLSGAVEMSMWKARGPGEAEDFLHPPKREELPAMGRLVVHRAGTKFPIDVKDDVIGKPLPLGDTGVSVRVDEYLPAAKVGARGLEKDGDLPRDPLLKVSLMTAKESRQYVVSAIHPSFIHRLDAMAPGDVQAAPYLDYYNPAAYVTERNGTRGRLQLLEGTDGKLYLRRFGLTGLEAATVVEVNKPYAGWMGLQLTVTDHLPAARFDSGFRPARVSPAKMDEANRAMKVAVTVDGRRFETWVARSDAAARLDTPRGPVSASYEMEPYVLPFKIALVHAERKNDPGSDNPAAYTSEVEVTPDGGSPTRHTITMNEPLTVDGLTFYQAGFQQIGDVTVSTLSVRRDPGWVIKYAGCGLIVAGIFTMFYMKAYFQKPRAAVATGTRDRGTGVSPVLAT